MNRHWIRLGLTPVVLAVLTTGICTVGTAAQNQTTNPAIEGTRWGGRVPSIELPSGLTLFKIRDTRGQRGLRIARPISGIAPAPAPSQGPSPDKLGPELDRKRAIDAADSEGTGPLAATAPSNDACGSPIVVGPGTFTLDASCAGTDPGDPLQGCTLGGASQNSRSVWFQFTAAVAGRLNVDTCGSNYDTVLSIWATTSCPTPAAELCCNDDAVTGPCAFTVVSVVMNCCLLASQTVLIEVTDFESPGVSDMLTLNVAFTPDATCQGPPTPPANDGFANAIAIPPGACPFTDTRDTRAATDEVSDPEPSCGDLNDRRSVWYTSTSPSNCQTTIDTCASNYDTVLSAYTGSPGNFVEVGCNDDNGSASCPSSVLSGITFIQQANVTYWIEVNSFDGTTGGDLVFNACCMAIGPPLCNAPCVAQDAWTASEPCALATDSEGEEYSFDVSAQPGLVLVDKYKVPREGYPDGICVDYFFQASNPLCASNLDGEDLCLPVRPPNVPILILNDIEYPGTFFPPNAIPYEVVVGVRVPFTKFPTPPAGGRLQFDWWKVVEFHPLGPYVDGRPGDCDGDGDVDCGLVINRTFPFPVCSGNGRVDACAGPRIQFRLTECTDNFGAEVIEFFVNRRAHQLQCLNVFEPHPRQPRRSFPAVNEGEDAATRPWCFTLTAP